MSALNKIAFFQDRRDEAPNQELARELAQTDDREGIREIAENLQHKNKSVQSDCLKVLYEIGYIKPELIADYVDDFLKLLSSKNNRMVWGAMIALSTIADRRPREIWEHIDTVIGAVKQGTVITVVSGVKALAGVAAANAQYGEKIFPVLLDLLQTCIPRDVPTHAENMLCAVNERNKADFLAILEWRQKELSSAQLARFKQVIRQVG